MIRVENLTFSYPRAAEPAVRDASFAIEHGRIFGFLGPSGSGKSTVIVFGIWAFKNTGLVKDSEGPDTSEFALDATENFDLDEVLSHGLPVIIDFGADSCVPCKDMAPILVELNNEYRGKAVIKFVDVWKNPAAAEGFPLRVIPTQFFFDKEGNFYGYHEGGLDKESIVEILEELGAGK